MSNEKQNSENQQGHVEIDYTAKCDLCGHRFFAIHKFPEMKADCPNCMNEVYTDAFENFSK